MSLPAAHLRQKLTQPDAPFGRECKSAFAGDDPRLAQSPAADASATAVQKPCPPGEGDGLRGEGPAQKRIKTEGVVVAPSKAEL
jgi:hypothetical protein